MTVITNDNYKDTRFAKELINQIRRIPTLKYFEHKTEPLLFRSLYFALSDYYKYYDYIFPKEFRIIDYPHNWDDVNETIFNKSFYLDQVENKSKGHIGHICAAVIPAGKNVYNCDTCGVDSTCCLCEDCFNKEEHSDHDVKIHKSTGDAICDCGDTSSWKVPLHCKANENEEKLKKRLPPLPETLKENISIMVRVLFDFILDVHSTNLSPLPWFDLKQKQRESFLEDLAKIDTVSPYNYDVHDAYKALYTPDVEKGPADNVVILGDFMDYYCLVVWNDEFHNFDEANRFLSVAYSTSSDYESDEFPYFELNYSYYSDMDVNEDGVTELAKVIDEKGFVLYARSKNKSVLEKKIEKFRHYEEMGHSKLNYNIITAKEYANICLSRSIMVWFDYILKNENILLTDYIRQEITKVMFEPANFTCRSLPLFNDLLDSHFLLNKDMGIPIYKERLNSNGELKTDIDKIVLNLNDKLNPVTHVEYLEKASRLQYMVFFEMRFPKSMRKLFKKNIIPTISNTTETRFEFSKQLLTILPTCEYNVANNDREWHLSILETFRLQVFHDPNAGTELLKLGLLTNVIDSILNIFGKSASLSDGKYRILTLNSWKLKRSTSTLARAIEGFSTLLKFIHEGHDQVFHDDFIFKILRLFTAFDEIYKMTRRADVHELYEDEQRCAMYLSSEIPLYSIAESLGKICYGFTSPNEQVEKSIVLISSYLKSKRRNYHSNGIISFDVTQDGVTICHPIGGLLAETSRGYKFHTPELFLKSVSYVSHKSNGTSSFQLDTGSILSNFIGVADEMLQPWVFRAQLISNFWVRNGVYADLANSFFDLYRPQNNLFMMQQGILLDQLPLDDFIDRYMLQQSIHGEAGFDNTIYEEKLAVILSEFVSNFYHILTFRQYYDSNLLYNDCAMSFNEITVACILACKPMKYSELQDLSPSDYYPEIVNKIAKYIAPVKYNEYGMYTIADDYWSNVDPFNYFNTSVTTSDVEEAIIKNLAKLKNKKEDDIVLTPYLYPLNENDAMKFKKIGEYMKTKEFVKLLYKILRFAVTSEIDSHLNVTLQLIHAIIIDDELYNKENHGLKYFVEIPICNLLLNAAEKTDIPRFIAKKASTILEKLLLKDDDVLTSLMDCFGESHIEEYKKSKHGKNLETKMERKKRMALKRQQKILKKMKKQQTAFADNNKTFFEDADTKSESSKDKNDSSIPGYQHRHEHEARTCIICKNPENDHSIFGVPAFISTSSIFWTIPTVDDEPPDFMVPEFSEKHLIGDNKDGKSSCTREKLVIHGCPHGMHYSCFETMLKKKNMTISNFTCPLCKGKFNTFLPSLRMGEIEVDPNGFENIKYDAERIYRYFYGDNAVALRHQIFQGEVADAVKRADKGSELLEQAVQLIEKNLYLKKCLPPFKALLNAYYRNLRKGFYSQFSMPLIIASTLEMYEISSRDEGTVSLPEILTSILKSLLQFRIIISNHDFTRGEKEKQKYFEFLLNNPYLGFMETTVVLFTESDIPLTTCLKYAVMKRIVYIGLSIMQRFNANRHNLDFDSLFADDVEDLSSTSVSYQALANILDDIIKECHSHDGTNYKRKDIFVQKLYKVLKSNYKYYERQVKYLSLFFNTLPVENGEPLLPTLDEILSNSLKSDSNETDFMILLIKTITMGLQEKKFPKCHKRDESIDIIEYPRPVHLIDLPEKLKDIALSNQTEKVIMRDEFDGIRVSHVKCSSVCLHCGKWVNKTAAHVKECKLSGYSTLIFTPMKNQLTLLVAKMVTARIFKVESPYLNKHGEPSKGLVGLGDAGILSKPRYEHLQQVWFNQSIIAQYIRDSSELVQFFPISNDAVSDVYIPGIFEPNEESLQSIVPPPSAFGRLFGFPDLVFEPGVGAAAPGVGFGPFGIMRDDDDDDDRDVDDPDYNETEYVADGEDVFTGNLIAGLRAMQNGLAQAERNNNEGTGGVNAGEDDDDEDDDDDDYNNSNDDHDEHAAGGDEDDDDDDDDPDSDNDPMTGIHAYMRQNGNEALDMYGNPYPLGGDDEYLSDSDYGYIVPREGMRFPGEEEEEDDDDDDDEMGDTYNGFEDHEEDRPRYGDEPLGIDDYSPSEIRPTFGGTASDDEEDSVIWEDNDSDNGHDWHVDNDSDEDQVMW